MRLLIIDSSAASRYAYFLSGAVSLAMEESLQDLASRQCQKTPFMMIRNFVMSMNYPSTAHDAGSSNDEMFSMKYDAFGSGLIQGKVWAGS